MKEEEVGEKKKAAAIENSKENRNNQKSPSATSQNLSQEPSDV